MNLAKLTEFGIKATVTQAGKLHLEAPKGTITPKLREEIAQNRDFLLAEVNMVNLVNIKSSCTAPCARAYTGDGHVHQAKNAGFGEHGEHGELQNHMYGPAHAHIYPESHVHQPAANDPDSTPVAVLDPDRHCYPHSSAANTSELDLMGRRLEQFKRLGLDVDTSERLAGLLMLRDRDPQDDRHICLECLHCQYGRCGNVRVAGLSHPELGQDYALTLKRCNGYTAGIGTLAGPVLGFVQVPKKPPQQYHPLNTEAKQLARAYHDHHFNCPKCRTGRGERCQRGTDLWKAYAGGDGDGR